MADAELSAHLARRRLRSRASNEDFANDQDMPSALPIKKQPEINNNMEQPGRRRRSRASTNSSDDGPLSPAPPVASKPIGFVQPEVQRKPSQNEAVSEVTSRRRSRASRSSEEEHVAPPVAVKPQQKSQIPTSKQIMMTPARSVRESASKFENIVSKITVEEEQYHKQQRHQKEIHKRDIEEKYHDDYYDDDDDEYYDDDEEVSDNEADDLENDLEVEEELKVSEKEVYDPHDDETHKNQTGGGGDMLLDNIRQHMEAYEPFGQRPFDEPEYEEGVEIEEEQLEDEYSDEDVEEDEEVYRGSESEDTDDTARLVGDADSQRGGASRQFEEVDQSRECGSAEMAKSRPTVRGQSDSNGRFVSHSFVTVGSASGQQQPQNPPPPQPAQPQQQQKQQYQPTNQTPPRQSRVSQPTNQQRVQPAQQQPIRQQQPQQQQRQQRAQQKQQPISTTTSEEPYSPYQAQPFVMSMRAPRAGDMFHNEMKMEKRYDEEEKLGTPQRVLDWIARSLQQAVPAPNGADWKSIQLYIRDGVILCKLLNRLLKHAGMEPVGYRQKVNSAFVALNNIETFMAGAKRYGVPQTSFFQPSDLYEGRKGHLLAVVNCLNALGCVANARGFTPPYQEPAPPKADWCKEECYE